MKLSSMEPIGISEVDRLARLDPVRVEDYISGVSAYVRSQATLAAGPKKACQIRLSNALGRALADELGKRIPGLRGRLRTDERKIAGGLRTMNADVSESHELDGLRLAVEIKPVNIAVGRAIWNRFGDIRTFAVNVHLKFPFAVVGGVLVIPSIEIKRKSGNDNSKGSAQIVSTVHLIERTVHRLIRAGGRKSEAEAAHLLEGIAVLVYNPYNAKVETDLPEPGSGLRWDEFISDIETAYTARFEA